MTSPAKIIVDSLPLTVEEFIALRDKISTTPEGGAVAFVVATILYVQSPALGRHALIIQSDKALLSASDKGYKGFDLAGTSAFLVTQLDQKKYIPGSYVLGTTNETAYEIGKGPYTFELSTNASSILEDGQIKIFVACSGADTPRPVLLRKNDKGVWKASEYSSLFVGVKAPVVKSKGAEEGDF